MHVRLKSVVLTALLAAAPSVLALPYRVDLSVPIEGATATLHARQVDGDAEPIRRELTLPATGALPDVEGTWELRIESERVWAPIVYARTGDPNGAVVTAVPAGRVQAKLAKSDAPPPEVRLFLTPPEVGVSGKHERAELDCPVREGEILCTVPAGAWDVQLTPKGFVPQYRWNVRMPADRITKLETIPLIRGASVVGTVTRVDRTLPLPADTRVRLVPSTMAPQEARSLSYDAKPNAKGFFQIVSVPPGEYFLSATAKSLTSDSQQILVVANRTAELRSPLVIDTPRRVRVMVTPKSDPANEPWLMTISVKRPGAEALDSYSTSKVDAEGVWEQKGLRDGEYLLTVERQSGGQWFSRWFSIAGGDVELPVTIPSMQIEGTVTYGDQPVAARITFGGESGSRRQLLTSGSDGRFAGLVPELEEEPWDVLIESDAPPTRLTLHDVRGERKEDDPIVRVELRLPNTAVMGSVVRPDGTPAGFATINIRRTDGMLDQISAARDGTFQISALPPGNYDIVAEAFLLSSDVARYEIRADDNPPLRLQLRDSQQVKGRLVTPTGVPVIGASIGMLPADEPKRGIGFDATNEHGAFVVVVRAGVTQVDLLIAPPGFSTLIGRAEVRNRFMEIMVDQNGGALIAEVPPNSGAWLSHEGASWPVQVVTRVSAGVEENLPDRRRLTIPSLHPGQYSLCAGEKCASGYVPPHGTLRLSVK